MNHFDDDQATEGSTVTAGLGDETELARRAGAGDKQAFDLLYDRYFARTSWYFSILERRDARAAVKEVLTQLFGSLTEPSDLPLAERAYRLTLATELRHAAVPEKTNSTKAEPVRVEIAENRAAKTLPLQV